MQWFETARGVERLQLETMLVQSEFPTFRLDMLDDGRAVWAGTMGPSGDLRDRYSVAIVYPSNYLAGRIPRVEVLDPQMTGNPPHRFTDGSLCLEHGDFRANDPITEVFGWTYQWLALYENFLRTGERW